MPILGVKGFYVALENLCEEGSHITADYFTLVAVAALLATGGLLINSIPVIIGSMCVAPFLGPSRAVAIGLIYHKWKTVAKGLAKQVVGLAIIGSVIGFLTTLTFDTFLKGIVVTTTIDARTFPTATSFDLAVFIAVSAGVAAALALVAKPWVVSLPLQQLIDVMIGVEIAISLIPPAVVVGIGMALGEWQISFQALGLMAVNVICLDFVAMLVLRLKGVHLKPLQAETKIAEIVKKTIKEALDVAEMTIDVTLKKEKRVDVSAQVETIEKNYDASTLVQRVSKEIEKETSFLNKVKITINPVSIYEST
jgi:uncharacterized hydrophobic protein (TIGR00271 family)